MPPFPTSLPLSPADPWLETIQGNIVKSHGRQFTRLIFFIVQRQTPKNINLLTEALVATATRPRLVTSAADLLTQADTRRATGDANGEFYSLGLSEEFFWKTGLEIRADMFPPEDGPAKSFKAGAVARLRKIDAASGSGWDSTYEKAPHGVWLLAHQTVEGLDAMQKHVTDFLRQHRASVLGEPEDGFRWSDDVDGKLTREPFGYRDGVSMPDFFKPASREQVPIALDRVFITTPGAHQGGSFLVLRKYDQNVKGFLEFEDKLRAAVALKDPSAPLIGRLRDGTPLVEAPPADLNSFDFNNADDSRCPFHAHIRKANPRTDSAVATDRATPHAAAQIVRRGVVYDEHKPRVLPDRSGETYATARTITGGVGLLFMAYMSSIENQFERMERNWFLNPNFPFPGVGMPDPLIKGSAVADGKWTWGERTVEGFSAFVRPRGGVYFYVPTLTWLARPGA